MLLLRQTAIASSKFAGSFVWTALAIVACTTRPEPTSVSPGVRAQSVGFIACDSKDNPIQCENRQNGSPWRLVAAVGETDILEGFASQTSVNKNETIDLYVNLNVPEGYQTVEYEVYRMGWYDAGVGGRSVYGPYTADAGHQFACLKTADTGLVECSNWTVTVKGLPTAQFTSPDKGGPVSGYYLVKLSAPPQPADPKYQSYIIFVMRDDGRDAGFLVNSAVNTYQAYNDYGDNSLYSGLPDGGPVTQVSFDRPYTPQGQGTGHFFDPYPSQFADKYLLDAGAYLWPGVGFEYLMVRFLEREGYDVTYATDIDLHSRPALLVNRQAFLSVGHDEYWSKDMHDNLEVARDRSLQNGGPTNIAFFSGNSVYWIVNVLPNTAQTVPYRRIEAHKWWPWYDPRLPWTWANCSQVLIGGSAIPVCTAAEGSEQKLVGLITIDGMFDRGDFVFSSQDFTSDAGWMFQDTGLTWRSRLPGMIGGEAMNFDAGRPAPSSQTLFGQSQFKARPHQFDPEYQRADMSLYQPDNGALVVSLGAADWSFGLDIYTPDFQSTIYLRDHPAIPQMTRNILEGIGGLAHVSRQQPGPGYAVALPPGATCFAPNQVFTVQLTAPAGRGSQQCTLWPWCDAISVYNVLQNDDDDPASKIYILGNTAIAVNAPSAPGTYTADYVTVDRTFPSDWTHPDPQNPQQQVPDQLRTIWRAAKSPRFCVPCPCNPDP